MNCLTGDCLKGSIWSEKMAPLVQVATFNLQLIKTYAKSWIGALFSWSMTHADRVVIFRPDRSYR